MISSDSRTAVCTIVSKNYLHFARTLMDSVRTAHPDWRQYVLLVDEVCGDFDPAAEKFEVVEVTRLPLPNPKQFLFRYTILELNTAVKPWLLEWLFTQAGVEQVVYLDPDIYVYRPLAEVEERLAAGNLMVLTPHLTGDLRDGKQPGEGEILKAGAYNLGFIALGRHPDLPRFLKWWQTRLEHDCRVSCPDGLFVDQKWMDLAPGLFGGVSVLQHPGYNVAYWNLAHRKMERANVAAGFSLRPPSNDGRRLKPAATDDNPPLAYTVNGEPLVFFHYSGLNPQAPGSFSKHQNRFRLRDLGPARELVEDYCRRVLANGQAVCSRWKYSFGEFANGEPIPNVVRQLYRSSKELQKEAGDDPFAAGHEGMNRPWGSRLSPPISRLMRAVWESRPDLQQCFPDIDHSSRHYYASAFLATIWKEEHIPARFVDPLRAAWQQSQAPIFRRIVENPTLRKLAATLQPLARIFPKRLREGLVRRLETLATMGKYDLIDRIRRSRIVRELKHLIPDETRKRFKRSLIHWSLAPKGRRQTLPASRSTLHASRCTLHGLHGLNVIGYIRSEHGVGESARMCARSAMAAGVPFSLHDFNLNNDSRTGDRSWDHLLSDTHRHWINLFHINADQIPLTHAALGKDYFAGRYNIGFWHWELPEFPDEFRAAFDLLDEIWTPTRFVQDAVASKSPIPVLCMPHGIHCEPNPNLTRYDLDLPADRFLFLTMYDVRSFSVRKNPRAAIAAFRKAFPDGEKAGLVVKVNNPDADRGELDALRDQLADLPGVYLIDRIMARADVYRLEELCDCFVSLHRSEGFGLGLAESMFLGRPVIGTHWSANVDFMDAENSCPVRYELVRLERDYGPYRRGQVWADPDIDHAAWYMRRLVNDPAWAKAIALRGQHTIRTHFSPAAAGQRYQARLAALAEMMGMKVARAEAA